MIGAKLRQEGWRKCIDQHAYSIIAQSIHFYGQGPCKKSAPVER
jgi:hypothetical protein